ncbi:MAG: DUF4595 domain-containing protein [Bacteroidales bacterium]|nr:DUF4595 domain-containing protein [Bacteroidales bacterium]
MKKYVYFLTALLVIAGCDGLIKITDNSGNGNGGGNSEGDNPSTDNGTNIVTQPKGAVKRIFDVQTDNRGWHNFDYDDVYIYDAQGRIVTDKCNQKTYNGQTGQLLWDDDYEYTYYYNGTQYEWWNSPDRKDKAHEGTLNAKGQLISLKRGSSRTDTFTYDADGHLTKFVKDSGGGNKTTVTYTWNDGLMISSVTAVTSGASTVSTERRYIYGRANPTLGHYLDLNIRFCFPETNQIMMVGLGPERMLTDVLISSSAKATSDDKIERHIEYKWDSNSRITGIERTILKFPCAEEDIVRTERDIDTYTVTYYN